MITVLLPLGVALVLVGAAVSTVTTEAAPGRPQKRPISVPAMRVWNATALVLILAGIVAALVGAGFAIASEVAS